VRGTFEELDTAPRFLAKDRAGHVRAEKSWGETDRIGHEGALDHLLLERAPELPQVACFDTAFHATSPELAQRFALPARAARRRRAPLIYREAPG
jgi:hypothetical protein